MFAISLKWSRVFGIFENQGVLDSNSVFISEPGALLKIFKIYGTTAKNIGVD